MRNKVFIATSLDNYIADENGGIDWLTDFPPPTASDGGFSDFMDSVDAIVMGRNTFERVLSFGIQWPYVKKVFVWSNTLTSVPSNLTEKVELVSGNLQDVIQMIQHNGFVNIYVDGGKTIQTFLNANLIHEIILTQVPIVLGRGISLFEDVPRLRLQHRSTQVFDNGMVQSHYFAQEAL